MDATLTVFVLTGLACNFLMLICLLVRHEHQSRRNRVTRDAVMMIAECLKCRQVKRMLESPTPRGTP